MITNLTVVYMNICDNFLKFDSYFSFGIVVQVLGHLGYPEA
jgi:hypothetical protein